MPINLANQLTLARLVLAPVFFILLICYDAHQEAAQRWLMTACFWIFIVAVITDFLDGLIARATHTVTSFGRIVDPVVDKVLICGTFILFAGHNFWNDQHNVTAVHAWMAVVIVARELLVSAIRAYMEMHGQPFPATWAGKAKMVLQSATVALILGRLAWGPGQLAPLTILAVWATVLVTAASAIDYVYRARDVLLAPEALGRPKTASRTAEAPGTEAAASKPAEKLR